MFRLRRAAGYACTLSTVGVGVGAYGTYYTADDLTKEGFERSVKFWSKSFPIYLHYRMYQLLNRDLRIISDDYALQQYDKLHEKYSVVVKDIVYGMRGFYLKNAQMLSTQDDFVPPAYMKWVKDTQDNVPTEFIGPEAAKNYVKLKLREELQLEFDDVFSYWDDEPLGIASIGQVHKARLKGNGKLVAVKILVPGIENKFRWDKL
jgi:aarF domain-containing kinase